MQQENACSLQTEIENSAAPTVVQTNVLGTTNPEALGSAHVYSYGRATLPGFRKPVLENPPHGCHAFPETGSLMPIYRTLRGSLPTFYFGSFPRTSAGIQIEDGGGRTRTPRLWHLQLILVFLRFYWRIYHALPEALKRDLTAWSITAFSEPSKHNPRRMQKVFLGDSGRRFQLRERC
jgi:hypothetical protein